MSFRKPSPVCALCFAAVAALLAAGCASRSAPGITLATTTSVQDSGLLDLLVPLFRERAGIAVKVIAVGTGQALQLGRRGDADVLLVHDPDAEGRFMEEGHGESRREVMHNDFVILGPPADPAGVKGSASASEAFTRITRAESAFVSRGDESGTHQREKAVWKKAGVVPKGAWYVRAGAGMGQVLRMASEKRGYTLSDRGTYLALRKGLELTVLHEGDPVLVNRYSVIVVSKERHPHARVEEARRFADFLQSEEARKAIRAFGVDRHGQPLFRVD
jgi:tungstate transport system substrate-binding protein